MSVDLLTTDATAQWPRQRNAKASGTSTIALYTFYALVIFCMFNVAALLTRLRGVTLPLNPIVFALAAVLILVLTPTGKNIHTRYFMAAWVFWVAYAIGGFLGPYHVASESLYFVTQRVIKIWITLIGIPWLATRVVRDEAVPYFVKFVYVTIAIGALPAFVQIVRPDIVENFVMDTGRGAGFWVDPNNCAALSVLAILFNLMYPLRQKWANVFLRAFLICTMLVSLSRSGIAAGILCLLVYGLLTRRAATTLKVVGGILAISLAGTIVMNLLIASGTTQKEERLEHVKGILRGSVSSDIRYGRWTVWEKAFSAVSEDWLLGRGHGAMERVVKIGGGLGPHNYYLYVWGNSGVVALIALLGFGFVMFRVALRCRGRTHRAGMITVLVLLSLLAMFSHALFDQQFYGIVFAVFAVVGRSARRSRMRIASYYPHPAFHAAANRT